MRAPWSAVSLATASTGEVHLRDTGLIILGNVFIFR